MANLTPEQQSALAKFQAFAAQRAAPNLSQGAQKEVDPVTNVAAQLAGIVDPSSSGGAWGTKAGKQSGAGFGPEGFLKKMAENFYNQTGLSDLSKLGVRTTTEYDYDWGTSTSTPYEVNTYYNKDTGEPVNFSGNLGGYGEGPGWTHTSLSFAGDKPVLRTTGEDTSDLGTILPALTLLTLPFGGIGGILSGITGTAGVGGLAGAALGELGMQTAGSGLAGTLASAGLPSTLANIGANAVVSGGLQGGISKLAGGDFSKGFRSGALSGGIGAGVNELGTMTGLDKGLGSLYTPAKSLATSALTAAARGKPFDLEQSLQNAALNYGLNQVGQASGLDPKQQAAMMKFLNFAAPMIAARRKP